MIKIAPSLLTANFSKMAEEIKEIENAGADLIHIDVMDGHFVPNITIGPDVISCFRRETSIPFDVHLMIDRPDLYVDRFIDAEVDMISVHVESRGHLHRTIQKIKSRNVKAGIALNPSTPLNSIKWMLQDIDMIVIMTVNPGFGGQKYINTMTQKIKELKEMLYFEDREEVEIEVDGGIDLNNVSLVKQAGASIIVSGTTVFNSENKREVIDQLRDLRG